MTEPELDFKLFFEQSPEVLLVLLPDAPRFTMVAATDARLRATLLTREQTVGRGLFELFPDNPDDPKASGAANLRASLDRVLATKVADTMAVQKYDIREQDGSFATKYWSPKNIPILSADGTIKYILHRVEDVTELVVASEVGKELQGRTGAMEREVINRSRELSEANRNLRDANVKLGQLDAAKTAFFSNISHEFRTPLTLMLGPIEDALADTDDSLSPEMRARIKLAHNNTLRLYKLVNALLDFSRLEAGRMQSHFAPLDLGGFTAELAGMFQSAAEKNGLKLIIECPAASEPAWVDREMWEKIVPNLVSNALKFTQKGSISVRLRETSKQFVLEVADTGIGIPESELAKVFERFHRVVDNKARTQEGTGIGLSLVRELVQLHGGVVTADSKPGHGTTFRIEIPKGFAHLPADSVSSTPADPTRGSDAQAHAAEATSWHANSVHSTADANKVEQAQRGHVLVVDDNADLRQYLAGLLATVYDVSIAGDGMAALETVAKHPPDLIVSDVMMPRLDGFGLVKALRDDPATASIPVILLSARAGEESAIDGLNAGADDYLVKPFSARELLARVHTHIQLARTRRDWINELEIANRELDAFSYSVSHDLRAPLRAIEGFARSLLEDCGKTLPPQGLEYVHRICDGVKRMNVLVQSLLDLARISRSEPKNEIVDLSVLAAGVVEDLRQAHPDRQIIVDIQPGMLGRGDPHLLSVVLVNLLGNAWKFTSHNDHAKIEIGKLEGHGATFFVHDNGAGFDMAETARLFAPFQRLHSAQEFAGTGVGLATVERVISRHGGRIWAHGEVNRGATFFFSLPESRTNDDPLLRRGDGESFSEEIA